MPSLPPPPVHRHTVPFGMKLNKLWVSFSQRSSLWQGRETQPDFQVESELHPTVITVKETREISRVPTAVDQQNSMIFPGFQSFFQVFFCLFLAGFMHSFSKTNEVRCSNFLQKKLLAKNLYFFKGIYKLCFYFQYKF